MLQQPTMIILASDQSTTHRINRGNRDHPGNNPHQGGSTVEPLDNNDDPSNYQGQPVDNKFDHQCLQHPAHSCSFQLTPAAPSTSTCTYCGRWGHFTSVCFRRLNDGNRQRETNRPPRTQTNRCSVNRIENDQRNPHSSGSDTEYVFHTGRLQTFETSTPPPTHKNGNIWVWCKGNHPSPRPIQHTSRIHGHHLPGRHTCDKESRKAHHWLGDMQWLGLLSAHKLSINHISDSDTQIPPSTLKLLDDHADLFNGLGKLKGKKVHLHIDETIPPVAQRYRRIPFHVRKDVEEQIYKDEKLGVIEKAEGPTPWVSPIVVVPKRDQNKIRVCIDMKAAKKAIKRKRRPTPTLDELKTILSGANIFSKLDLNQGFNQLGLAEEFRYITTFATHLGLYRYKRLFFSVNSASEIFQEEISQALAGINGAINISDDILCFGSDQQDHDQNLHAIFQRIREKGLTLNGSKCEYNKRSLEFLGHTFGNKGISPSSLKIKTILGLPNPKNASEVRSLLGMTNFCGAPFIPNYATLTHDLRQLTKKKTLSGPGLNATVNA
ncbi:unnamed protein product [Acanthosepion pharaonis]|uniref:Reverse transcriptase domain-containing protein n=1 Tax=Acanthosepion pharaonis TaxID=158019 RepID=A0A812D849_ACAPH|nr:unnamed protein product [Sepia pharaonis]